MIPVLLLENSHTIIHPIKNNNSSPVGILTPPILNAQKLSKILAKLPSKVMVVLNPYPIGHFISGLLKGSSNHPIHIKDIAENPA